MKSLTGAGSEKNPLSGMYSLFGLAYVMSLFAPPQILRLQENPQLTSLRLTTLAVMLDNAFGIFNNLPPRFQWSEIDLPFPCSDIYFNTPNYAAMAASNLFPQLKMKL